MDVTIQTIQEVYETIDVSVPLGLSHGAVGTWPRRYRREVTVRDGNAGASRDACSPSEAQGGDSERRIDSEKVTVTRTRETWMARRRAALRPAQTSESERRAGIPALARAPSLGHGSTQLHRLGPDRFLSSLSGRSTIPGWDG